jgi:hypothetical protein
MMALEMHLKIPTTFSMIMTFVIDCILKDTRASDFLFQNLLVDRTRDQLLYIHCLWNNEQGIFLIKTIF